MEEILTRILSDEATFATATERHRYAGDESPERMDRSGKSRRLVSELVRGGSTAANLARERRLQTTGSRHSERDVNPTGTKNFQFDPSTTGLQFRFRG